MSTLRKLSRTVDRAERRAGAKDARAMRASRRRLTGVSHKLQSRRYYLKCVNAAEDVTNELIRMGHPGRGVQTLAWLKDGQYPTLHQYRKAQRKGTS